MKTTTPLTEEEILKKAIEKAEKNGYKFPFYHESKLITETLYGDFIWVPKIIFSHEFAKAFFGEEDVLRIGLNESDYVRSFAVNNKKGRTEGEARNIAYKDWEFWKKTGKVKPVWQFHLQQMVLSENPILYLEQYI